MKKKSIKLKLIRSIKKSSKKKNKKNRNFGSPNSTLAADSLIDKIGGSIGSRIKNVVDLKNIEQISSDYIKNLLFPNNFQNQTQPNGENQLQNTENIEEYSAKKKILLATVKSSMFEPLKKIIIEKTRTPEELTDLVSSIIKKNVNI